MFDFIDCGGGKERADSKIRQNFELFVSNPYCSAVFLAVCYDNGFVRMLEPYQSMCMPLRNKIVLVRAGQTAPEFAKLPFEFVEFPTVFREQYSFKIDPYRGHRRTLCIRVGHEPAGETEAVQNVVHLERVNLPSTSKVLGMMRASLMFRDAGVHRIPIIGGRLLPTTSVRRASVTTNTPYSYAAGGFQDNKRTSPTRPVPNVYNTDKIKEMETAIQAKEAAHLGTCTQRGPGAAARRLHRLGRPRRKRSAQAGE